MKRMVNENLIAILKEMDSKGVSVSDLAEVLENLSIDEDDNLKIKTNIDLDNNEIQDVNQIQFHDSSIMNTAPHLYKYAITISQDGVDSGNNKTLFIYTNEEIGEDLTFSKLLDIVSLGDIGVNGAVGDVEPIIQVVDKGSNYLQIYNPKASIDYEYDNTLTIEYVSLLKQLF